MSDLSGKVALVTGSGRGIGRATARALRDAGADVWVNVRSAEAAELAEQEFPGRVLVFDVADPAAVRAGFVRIQGAAKRLDILVNNAGILRDSVIEMAGVDMIDEVLRVNLRSVVVCSQYGVRLMARGGGGSIVNVASIIGRFGNAGQVVYGASKAGVIGATLSLSKEVAARNIRVNAVAPGVIDTDMIAGLPPEKRETLLAGIGMGRVGSAQDVASVCLFLASDAAAYVTGQVIGVDGGLVI